MNTIEKLAPCPFCGSTGAQFERIGTPRQSCIVACNNCGARHESSDEGLTCGSSWNDRAQQAGGVPAGFVAYALDASDTVSLNGKVTHQHLVEDEYTIDAERADCSEDWYINMRHPDGCHVYDGYWRNSSSKTADEVMQEAIRGACLPTVAPSPSAVQPLSEAQIEGIRALLWDEHPECCGSPVVGATYMGQQEMVCCGCPEPALLNDAQIVRSLRAMFPEPAGIITPKEPTP